MKMRKIIYFLFIFIQNNYCDESNESKYIDLLPEEEKEQFLQKIARRIFEEAEVTDDHYKQSREVSDDQLNEHTDFVKKLLREESANLRKQSRDEARNEDKSEEHMEVKPLVKDKISNERVDEENRYVDLTIRQGSRKKRKDDFNSDLDKNTEGEVNVDVKYTVENKVTENGEKSSLPEGQPPAIAEESVNKKDQSSFEDIQVKYFNKHETEIKKFTEIMSTTNKPGITQMIDFKAESVEKHSIEHTTAEQASENTEVSEPTTYQDVSENVETSSQRFTESIYESMTENKLDHKSTTDNIATTTKGASIDEEYSTINNTEKHVGNDSKKVLRSNSAESSTIYVTNGENYSLKENIEGTTIYNGKYAVQNTRSIENITLIENNDTNTHHIPDIEVKVNETSINNTVVPVGNEFSNTKRFSNNSDLNTYEVIDEVANNTGQTNNISVSENTLIKNASNIEINKKNNKTDITKSEISNDTSINHDVAARDIVAILRQRLLGGGERSDSNEIKGSFEQSNEETLKNKNGQTYSVYELPSNQQPFKVNKNIEKYKNREQPHYFPIYNYSVNNAYFNAQNRYGPNLDDLLELEERDIDIDYHDLPTEDDRYESKETFGALRDRDDNRKFRFGYKDSPKRSQKIPLKIMPAINQKQHFPEVLVNPDDYLDTDYYFGRTNTRLRYEGQHKSKKIPESDEDSHPSLNSIKDHIQSVRQILYQNKIFGFIPPINGSIGDVTPPEKPVQVTQMPPYKFAKRKGNKINNFGRLKLDDYYKKDGMNMNVGYVKYNNFIQTLHVSNDAPKELMKKVNVIKYKNQLFFRDDAIMNKERVKSLRNMTTIFSQDESSNYYDSIQKVLKLTNVVDLIPTLENMRGMNISYTRSGYVFDISAYLEVLSDILKTDNKSFIQYDWLGTTVDVQSALTRLADVAEAVQNKIVIHPADFGLLKYVVYLFQTAKTILYLEMEKSDMNLSRIGVLPRNKKRKPMFLKDKGLLNRGWLFKRHNIIESGVLNEFSTFISDLQGALFDLHSAVKHIALITKYRDQAWFKHLQRIYMKNDKKHLLEVMLHLSAARLFDLIEDSAKNTVEINMVDYIQNNDKHVERTVDEFVFVLRVLDEIKYM